MNATEKMEVLAEFGRAFNTNPDIALPAILKLLRGDLDEGLIEINRDNPNADVDIVRANLEALKNDFRATILQALDVEGVCTRAQDAEEARAAFRKQHAESEHGTTAEIAERLGVSKNEVRRMKKRGTLGTALNQPTQGEV